MTRNFIFPIRTLTVLLIASTLLFSPACRKESLPTPDEENVTTAAHSTPVQPSRILITQNTAFGVFSCQVLDLGGTVLQWKYFPSSVIDFKRWDINGTIRYTCELTNPSGYFIPTVTGHSPCEAVIMDEDFNEINRVRLLPYNGRSPSDPDDLDNHDFILIDDNHYITMTYYEMVVNNIPSSLNPVPNCKVVAPIIQEVENGNVLWEWNGTDFPELYISSQEGNRFSDTAQVDDYAHINSIYIDPNDNNLLCSFRNLDQIIKIERLTGQILWKLGGTDSDFPLTASQKFLRQHHATLTDNNETLLLFDNGNDARTYSRVVEFKLDEISKTVQSFKALNLPVAYYGKFQGSVQKFDDYYFVCNGLGRKMLKTKTDSPVIQFSKTLPYVSYRAFMY
ncbi:MAG: aryl-sulfate sulfotransferase [Bacteroidia bacterium]|nr:aryl-sulfate sulfotransferase [Bacteroidia bacterium]